MKKITFILFVITHFQLSFSQNNWSLGLSFESGISGMKNIEINTQNHFNIESRFSYSIDGIIDYKLNDKIHFKSGVGIKKLSFSFGENREDMDTTLLNLFAKTDTSLLHLQKWTLIPSYYYISVPLNIQYFINPLNKLNVFIEGGLTLNYLLIKNRTWINEYDNGINEYIQYPFYYETSKNLNFGLEVGIGMNYIANNQFRIYLEPSYHYFIGKTEDNLPINGNFYNLGVKVGFMYSL